MAKKLGVGEDNIKQSEQFCFFFLKLLCISPGLFSGIAQVCQQVGIRLLSDKMNWPVEKSFLLKWGFGWRLKSEEQS